MTRAILLSPPCRARDRFGLSQVSKEAFYGSYIGVHNMLFPEKRRWSHDCSTSSDRRPGVFRVNVGMQSMVPLHRQGTLRKPGLELPDPCHTGEVELTKDQR